MALLSLTDYLVAYLLNSHSNRCSEFCEYSLGFLGFSTCGKISKFEQTAVSIMKEYGLGSKPQVLALCSGFVTIPLPDQDTEKSVCPMSNFRYDLNVM